MAASPHRFNIYFAGLANFEGAGFSKSPAPVPWDDRDAEEPSAALPPSLADGAVYAITMSLQCARSHALDSKP